MELDLSVSLLLSVGLLCISLNEYTVHECGFHTHLCVVKAKPSRVKFFCVQYFKILLRPALLRLNVIVSPLFLQT